ncbi:discoidin domain-containing protein [Paenibacillus psychroresistens]|uniref:discoidin domain-containing protein n=1 Tax=Paenibacillus psychroresistens TaxID=1778678 RepID=UPI00386F7C1A
MKEAAKPNLALNKPATADSEETSKSHEAVKGNDGSTSTRWTAANASLNHWWKVDLGSLTSLTGSEVNWEHNNVYKYKVEISADNSSWTTVVDKTANPLSQQVQRDNFTANGRYVRITVTGLSAGEWASFYEFKVF